MKRIHYGWFVLLGCALLLFCTSGLCVNAFTIYQPCILSHNQFTNAQSSLIVTTRSLAAFLSMFLTGAYYRRLSLRSGMSAAGLVTAGGFVLFGLAESFPHYCLAAVLTGFGFGVGSMIPIAIVLEHWFHRKRTLAISLCSAVTGLSTLGIPNLLTWMIERWSLRATFLAEGAFVALLSLLTFLLVRDEPARKHMEAYGAGASSGGSAARQPGRSLQRKNWHLLVPMLLAIGAKTGTGYSHLAVLASSQGFDSHVTALAISVSGVMMTLAKCAYGWITERVGMYRSNRIFGGVLMAGMLLCCLVGLGPAVLFAAMCCYGGGLAMTTAGLSAWAGELSSSADYDRTVRRFQIGYAAGGLLFSSLPGILADLSGGSYIPAYIFFAVCTAFVIFAIQRTLRRSAPAGAKN